MTNPTGPTIATASVAIVPDFSKFAAEVDTDVRSPLAGIDALVNDVIKSMELQFADLATMIGSDFAEIRDAAVTSFSAVEGSVGGVTTLIDESFNRMELSVTESFDGLRRNADADLDQVAVKSAETSGIISGAFSKLMGIVSLGAAGIGAGLVALTGFGLKTAANLEQVRIAFQSLTGSVAAGNAQFLALQKFAAVTPFTFTDLTTGAQRFDAFSAAIGQSQAQLIPFLTTIGNLVSETGGGAQALDTITLALGQTASQGKLTLGNLDQINNAIPGFSSVAALAAVRGESTAQVMQEISAGSIDAKTGINQLLVGMQKFPGAAGAMQKQSLTLLGVWSTFTDTLSQSLSNAFTPVIPSIKNSLDQLTPILGKALGTLAPALGGILAGILPLLGQLVTGLVAILTPLLTTLGPALKPLGAALGALGTALGSIATAVAPVLPLLAQLISSLIVDLAPAITDLAPLFSDLVTQFGKLLPTLLPFIDELIAQLGPSLTPILEILGPVLDIVAVALTDILTALQPLIPILPVIIDAWLAWTIQQWALDAAMIASPIGLLIAGIALLIVGVVELVKHWGAVEDALKAAWGWIKNVGEAIGGGLNDALHIIADFFTTINDDIEHVFLAAWNAVLDFFEKLPGRILTAVTALPGQLLGIYSRMLKGLLYLTGYEIGLIIRVFIALPKLIIGIFTSLWHSTVALVTAQWHDLVALVINGVHTVVSTVTALPGELYALWWTIGHDTVNLVTDMYHRVINFFVQLPGEIIRAVTALWSDITHRFSDGASNVESTARSLPGRILHWFNGLKDDVIGWGKDSVHWLENAGKNIIHGLVNGVEDAVAGAIKAVKSAMGSIVSGAESALGIHSPSTVFAEIGHNVVLGYAQGVNQHAGIAHDATTGILAPHGIQHGTVNNQGATITLAAGAVVIQFNGVTPTHAEAYAVGQAAGQGVADVLAERSVRNKVRTM